jgi:hypothetical protein
MGKKLISLKGTTNLSPKERTHAIHDRKFPCRCNQGDQIYSVELVLFSMERSVENCPDRSYGIESLLLMYGCINLLRLYQLVNQKR